MIRKVGILLIVLAAIAGIYYYIRKGKWRPSSPGIISETSEKLGLSNEAAKMIDDRRNLVSQEKSFTPVSEVIEQMTYNGKTYPVLGYQRDPTSGKTVVMIPIEFVNDFAPFSGGLLTRKISGDVSINTGKYAGNWNANTIVAYEH